MDVQKTLEFADQMCEDARGDLVKMNRLAGSKGLKFYLDNVVILRTMEKGTFSACYPQFMEEIEGLQQAAEKAAAAEEEHTDQSDRIATLEAKMDKLTEALTRFMAATVAAEDETEDDDDPDPEPAAPKKRRARKPADTEPEAPEAPAEAEGDTEEAD